MPRSLRVIPERVIEARKARGWDSASELSRRAGLSQPTVWALENGITKEARYSTLAKIAEATGKHITFFTTTGDRSENITDHFEDEPLGRVPLISWVQAGNKSLAIDQRGDEWEEVSVPVSRHTFALRVRGDSMSPEFPEGTILIVDPAVEAKNGDYVVVIFDNTSEATFKRLVVDGPLKLLKALNPTYPTISVTDDARLCGVVVESNHRRKFK
jgi:SOS-response transcriptional repressor LexA